MILEKLIVGPCRVLIGILILIIVTLEVSHRGRILAEIALVLIRHVKTEARHWSRIWRRLKFEFTSGK